MYNLDGETKVAHVLRKGTIELMTEFNPEWRDLSADWVGTTDSSLGSELSMPPSGVTNNENHGEGSALTPTLSQRRVMHIIAPRARWP